MEDRLRAYMVNVSAPDPINAWTVKIMVPSGMILSLRGIASKFRTFHDQLDEHWTDMIKQEFGLTRVAMKSIKAVNIRSSANSAVMLMNVMPTALYAAANHVRYRLYYYLYQNGYIAKVGNQSIYLLPHFRVPDFIANVSDVQDLITDLNALATQIFEEEVKPELLRYLDELPLSEAWRTRIERNLSIKELGEVKAVIVPIDFGNDTAPISRYLVASHASILRDVFSYAIAKLRPSIESAIKNRRKSTKALQRAQATVDDLMAMGLPTLANIYSDYVVRLLDDPENEAVKYENYNVFEQKIMEVVRNVLPV